MNNKNSKVIVWNYFLTAVSIPKTKYKKCNIIFLSIYTCTHTHRGVRMSVCIYEYVLGKISCVLAVPNISLILVTNISHHCRDERL